MLTREQMHSVAQEIVRSYEERIADIAQLQELVKAHLKEAQDALKEFQNVRAAMSKELQADLAKAVADRKRAVSTQLKYLGSAHSAMSRELRTALAKGVVDRNRDVDSLLGGFDQAHTAMSRELRTALAKGVADRNREVGSLLGGFDQAHTAMRQELRTALAKGVADRKRDVGNLIRDFDMEQKGIRATLAGAKDEWQGLVATMERKRGIAVAEPIAAPQPLASSRPFEELSEADAVARAEPTEMSPETAGLRERVFEYLANHPDGTRMTVLEEEFSVSRIEMAKVLRSLMDDNKVEKRDLLYFAI